MNKIQEITKIRNELTEGKASVGSWIQIPHGSIAEIMGQEGYDWVAIDMEHGSISINQLPDLCRALELGGTLPLVRLSLGSEKDCKQALDAGAGGVIVPMVESACHLEKIKRFTRWPPSGDRGVAFSRANLFGKNFDEYNIEAQNPLFIAMIENINAVKNLEDILQVEGLDAILIGPYDLSASMGITSDFDNPKFISVIDQIKQYSDLYNIPCGIHVVQPSPIELRQKIDNGYRFIAYSMDSVFLLNNATKPDINQKK